MNRNWHISIPLLCVALFAQCPAAAADNPAPLADDPSTCASDTGHWRPGYWDFGPGGIWSNHYVVCPLLKADGPAKEPIAISSPSARRRAHFGASNIKGLRRQGI
jgi:hypothetical protein